MGNGDSIGWWWRRWKASSVPHFMDVGASEMPRAGASTPGAGCFTQVAFLGVLLHVVPNHTFMPMRSPQRFKCVGNITFLF